MPLPHASIEFFAYGQMDVGLHRTKLEDAFFLSEEQGLFIVSDGVGGAAAGSLASTVVVKTLPLELKEECKDLDSSNPIESTIKAQALGHVVDIVKSLLLEKTKYQPAAKGLGATVVVGYYVGNTTLALTHLGDSRAYLLRDATLERLTEDHTITNMLYQAGHITKEQMLKHPARHILTRYVGMQDCPEAEVTLLPLHQNDRLLFCSDGLTSMVDEQTIGETLAFNESQKQVANDLISFANEAGGHDNITVLVVDLSAEFKIYDSTTPIAIRKEAGYSLLPLERQSPATFRERTFHDGKQSISRHLNRPLCRPAFLFPRAGYIHDWTGGRLCTFHP